MEAVKRIHDCFQKNAPMLDDGFSDAATVGRSLAAACRPEVLSAADTYSQGSNDYLKNMMREQFIGSWVEGGASAILQMRVAAKNQTTPR